MLFAVSGVECSPFLLFFAAMAISFFTSMGGISGAFLLLPFQIGVLGYTTPSVSATNQLYNVLACPAGVWRYWREGRLLMPLVFYMAAGTLPGVFLGAWLRAGWLADLRRFMLFAAIVLGYIGIRLFFSKGKKGKADNGSCQILFFSWKSFAFSWAGNEYKVKFASIFALSLAVGLVGGIYGVGGGAIMSPFLISFFNLPVYVVALAT
ncbi:MAG: sulfite exporter TauE/SafE family protein, partial [Desulfovibrio sp.]